MFVFFGPSINPIYLLFTVFDIVFVMFLIRIICQFWDCGLLRWLNNAVEPVVSYITGCFERLLIKLTGKTTNSYTTLLIATAFCLFLLRQLMAEIFMNG